MTVEPPLNANEVSFLNDFNTTRRMDRGKGPLFVGGTGPFGQGADPDVKNVNQAPDGQPGLWCQWVPTDDGKLIEWDQGEKFYSADEWMRYLIDYLLSPQAAQFVADHRAEDPRLAAFTCDHVVNGEIEAQGEDPNDRWTLTVTDNKVETVER